MACRSFRKKNGFTLVELLVVIAIIGILVALLLPAVQSARESARRLKCTNQLRNIGLACLNLESSYRTFPSGGIGPWPEIECYSSGNSAFGPKKQGLSWAFQILPFLEEGAIHDLAETRNITANSVGLYYCPSRRPPTEYVDTRGVSPTPKCGGVRATRFWLMDYASLNPIPARKEIGNGYDVMTNIEASGSTRGCRTGYAFWGTRVFGNDHVPESKDSLGSNYTGFNGAIVRTSYFVKGPRNNVEQLNYTDITKVKNIRDGLSKTSLIAEKRIRIGDGPGAPYDDRGWSDGWDLDTVSSTACPPQPDDVTSLPGNADSLTAGSRHFGGLNTVFCDNSVRFVSYEIDLGLWNNFAHTSDGEVNSN